MIIGYNFIYDDAPIMAVDYLKDINRRVLLEYSIYYCNCTDKTDIYCGFVNKDDEGTEYYNVVVPKINEAFTRGEKISILNARTSLRLLELILANSNDENEIKLSDIEIRERLLKAYLVLNDDENEIGGRLSDPNEPLEYLLIHTSLRFGLYKYDECEFFYHWLAQIIKSVLFLRYSEVKLPLHLEIFLNEYGIERWKQYIVYLHQLIKLVSEDKFENTLNPLSNIIIDENEANYNSKKTFIDRFCLPVSYDIDLDFTTLKSTPIIYNKQENTYSVLFIPFFVDKIYSGLYFTFKDINKKSEGCQFFINPTTFRSEYGLEFSERFLLDVTMKDAFKGKYKHLSSHELVDKGLPDYYLRNGNKILLVENKDNLISKNIMDKYDTKEFVSKLRTCFVESHNDSEKISPKAIKQLSNNIKNILLGVWSKYDVNLKNSNCVIYPVIVVHHKEFTLPAVNQLVNDWFKSEILSLGLNFDQIRDVTIIDIDTLLVYQGLYSENKNNIFKLIDEYWDQYYLNSKKKYHTEQDVVNSFPERYKTFKQFIAHKFSESSVFTWQIKQYSKYFE